MSTSTRSLALVVALAAAGAIAYYSLASGNGVSATTQGTPTAPAAAPMVVATIDGEAITSAELESALGAELGRIEQQLYEMKRQRLDQLIGEKLLAREAARRQVSVEELERVEVLDKLAPVNDEEVTRFYEANKARLPQAPNIRDQIKRYLEMQGAEARREAYLESLRAAAKVSVSLAAPPVRRAEVDAGGSPIRGDANAPVTIVEFSDFHCPYCRTVQPTLLQLLDRYKGKVRLVYKDLPLDGLHPNARRVSEAARCAGDQGRFWEFHDAAYAGTVGTDVSPAAMQKLATAAGLDVAAFEACLASGRHAAGIQRDLEQAQRLGLSGTPAFFVNGRLLTGAQPFEAFAKVIDEELKP
jgi:protein-disulfide isomerase